VVAVRAIKGDVAIKRRLTPLEIQAGH